MTDEEARQQIADLTDKLNQLANKSINLFDIFKEHGLELQRWSLESDDEVMMVLKSTPSEREPK